MFKHLWRWLGGFYVTKSEARKIASRHGLALEDRMHPAGTHADEEAIAQDLHRKMAGWDVLDKAEFRGTERAGLVQFHHGFGTAIRNEYGLWRYPFEPEIDARGADCAYYHPDSVSMRIMERLWDIHHAATKRK